MMSSKLFTVAMILVLLNLLAVHPISAQSQNPGWVEDLEFQLAANHECEVAEYLGMSEGKIGGHHTYFAKVKCVDGREFDASKTEPQSEFTIRICKVVSC